MATDMRGFAQIPKGARGLCTNTFDFTGVAGQTSYSVTLAGQREGPFTLKADPDVTSWSQCGGTTSIMNMNTQCNISPTQQQALIAVGRGVLDDTPLLQRTNANSLTQVDRISGKLTVNISVAWKKC